MGKESTIVTAARAVVGGLAVASLAGCARVDTSQFGIKRAEPGTPNGFSFAPDNKAPAASTKAFIGGELDGLFARYPISDANKPETWPRVAITVISATTGVFKTVGFGDAASLSAGECAVYDVRVWNTAAESREYKGLRLCYGELYKRLQGVPLYQVPTWGRRAFWPGERNTGSVRNDGPLPPAGHFPNDPQIQMLWLDQFKNTLPFVAGPLAVMSFNWNDVTDKRVWFVSLPVK